MRSAPYSGQEYPLTAPAVSVQCIEWTARRRKAPVAAISVSNFASRIMFALFERLLPPTAVPEHPEPPSGLVGFYWHYARQAKGLFIGLFAAGFAVALLDSLIPVFMGRVVTLTFL